MTMEQPEVAPDLVGRTSARLLAAGIDRRDRLEALHLMAILHASIDTTGRVRRPLDDLAAEFELPPMSVMRSLDHLEQAGAVQRDGGGVLVLGAGDAGLGGLQLADFLDDVRASFDHDVRPRRRARLLARSGAVLAAAAAAVAIFTLAPGPATIDEPLALGHRAVSTTIEPMVVESAEPRIDPPITTIRPSTTIVAPPAVTAPLDTTVAATGPAAPADRCVPTSSIADRVRCIVHDGIADRLDGLHQHAPVAPESTTPAAEELVPLSPEADAPITPTVPAPTVVDLGSAVDAVEGVVRLLRS